MSLISVKNLSAHYGQVEALTDVSFALERGKVYGLIGMNGSGKSTLFKSLMGVHKNHTGHITIDGLTSQQARQKGLLSYLPQSEEIDFTFPLSVQDVVAMGTYQKLGISRRATSSSKKTVEEALMRVGLEDYAHRQIGALSGGQRKRAFLARSLAQKASIFFLDEPFAGVDKASESMMIELFKELADQGATLLISTHDLVSFEELAEEAILLRKTVLLQAPTAEVLQPENLMKAFGMNVLPRGKAC